MRMAGFWVVLNLVDLLLFVSKTKSISFVAFTARRFLGAAGLKSVVLHGPILLYSSLYIISDETGSRARIADCRPLLLRSPCRTMPFYVPNQPLSVNYRRCCPVLVGKVGSCEIESPLRC